MKLLLKNISYASVIACLLFISSTSAEAALQAERLRCEHRVTSLGIQNVEPRLDWIVTSQERDQRQTAYQILVASSPEGLTPSAADLWNSGRVESDQTTDVRYAGKQLAPHQQVYWKVGVWDAEGNEPSWSKASVWSMGPAAGSDWNAKWIGSDAIRNVAHKPGDFTDAQWITNVGDDPGDDWHLFAVKWSLPEGIRIKSANLLYNADKRCEVYVNGKQITIEQSFNHPSDFDVEESLVVGENDLRFRIRKDGGKRVGLIARLVVTDYAGEEHVLVTDEKWQITRHLDNWATGAWPADHLSPVSVIGPAGSEPWGEIASPDAATPPPVVYLRSEFEIKKPVHRAVLYASALGLPEMHLNGEPVSEDYFTPGWTDYTRRVYYRTCDVTGQLKQGENALGGILADGWYSGFIGWGHHRNHYGNQTRLKSLLHVEYEDGTTDDFGSDDSWKAGRGPTRYSDFLMGESYDAQQATNAWSQAGFEDAGWKTVDVGSHLAPKLELHPAQPVRVVEEFASKTVSEPRPGYYVIDLGQNFAGVVRLKVNGKPGQKIRLRYAERLNPDGTLFLSNMRTARATDTYICKGDGPEVWQQRFTFHGFQYVEVMGVDEKPALDMITGLALSSDTPDVGSFECSNPTINQLRSNIYWTQRSNFIDIPTDCPQRDERLGWTGDAQVYVATATLHTDVQAFFDKWLIDLEDSQYDNGQFPAVAPRKVAELGGGPAWSDAGVVCPWTIYQVYGDRDLLARQYPSMKRFIEFCRERSKDETLPPDSFHCFGDWLSIKANTPTQVIYTAYYAQSVQFLVESAKVLGKTEDVAEYQALFEKIKKAFNEAYVKEDGRIEGNTQCCYVLALKTDLLSEANTAKAAQYLVEDIEGRGNTLSTGFVGTKDLMLVLSKIGREDVAYRLLETDKFPGWCFSIKHGATSIWERWDGWTPESGFQTSGMNSFAHYSFGAVYQWMVETIAGIKSNEVAYKSLTIAPKPGGTLTWAKTSYDSVRGKISSSWRTEDDRFILNVTVPANTTAVIRIPLSAGQTVTEGGKPVADSEGVHSAEQQGDEMVIHVGSGSYEFVAAGS